MSISQRLKEERRRLGLTQEEFGKLGGVKLSTEKNYENGIRTPNAKYLSLIAKIGVDVQYILTGIRNNKRSKLCI